MRRNKLNTFVSLFPNVWLNLDSHRLEVKSPHPAKVVPMICDIWSCPVVIRSSLAQKFKFATILILGKKVLLESSCILTLNACIIVLPDVQSLSIDVSICCVEHDSLNCKRSLADDSVVDRQVNLALRPLIVFPVCADIRFGSLFRQSSIQVMENAFEWPSPLDSMVDIGKLQLREASCSSP